MQNDEGTDSEKGEAKQDVKSGYAPTFGTETAPNKENRNGNEHHRAEQSKILREWLTIGTLFVAGAAALYQDYVLSRQAALLEGQLGEMKSAGRQTDQLIKSNADLAAAAKAQAIASRESAKIAHDALQTGLRARIAAMNAVLENLQIGQPIKANISYSNIGHEGSPLDFIATMKTYLKEEWDKDLPLDEINSNLQHCMNIDSVKGRSMAYPSNSAFGGGYAFSLKSNSDVLGDKKFVADDDLIKGNKIIVVSSCIVYKTLEEIHHTSACYYYLANETPSLQSLNICEAGNAAD